MQCSPLSNAVYFCTYKSVYKFALPCVDIAKSGKTKLDHVYVWVAWLSFKFANTVDTVTIVLEQSKLDVSAVPGCVTGAAMGSKPRGKAGRRRQPQGRI